MQNQMFGVFIFLIIIVQLIMQIIPSFVTQRTLYEARERQSKTYDWRAFMLSNIVVEIFWNTVRMNPSRPSLKASRLLTILFILSRSWRCVAFSPGTILWDSGVMPNQPIVYTSVVFQRFFLSWSLYYLQVASRI